MIDTLLKYPVKDLPKYCHIRPGVPVRVMLGKPIVSLNAIFEQFADALFTMEWKYDGERAQIHLLSNGQFMIYSRNNENHTDKFPDVIRQLPATYQHTQPSVTSFIIDAEIVAYNHQTSEILPFQILSRRKRNSVEEKNITITVCVFAFDLLYLNGISYIEQPFINRRTLLHQTFTPIPNHFMFVHRLDSQNEAEMATFFQDAMKHRCEGVMVKVLNNHPHAPYMPDKRNWLKLKKDYLESGGDTVDLIPIGAFYGRGRRAGWFGSYLLACYDPESETYQSVTKV